MSVKIIYEDSHTAQLTSRLPELPTAQLYFIERACAVERKKRKQSLFDEWLCVRDRIVCQFGK